MSTAGSGCVRRSFSQAATAGLGRRLTTGVGDGGGRSSVRSVVAAAARAVAYGWRLWPGRWRQLGRRLGVGSGVGSGGGVGACGGLRVASVAWQLGRRLSVAVGSGVGSGVGVGSTRASCRHESSSVASGVGTAGGS